MFKTSIFISTHIEIVILARLRRKQIGYKPVQKPNRLTKVDYLQILQLIAEPNGPLQVGAQWSIMGQVPEEKNQISEKILF